MSFYTSLVMIRSNHDIKHSLSGQYCYVVCRDLASIHSTLDTLQLCGPGSIKQAHRANGFITVQQHHSCEAFIFNLVKEFLT
jgi:hypothetical protein